MQKKVKTSILIIKSIFLIILTLFLLLFLIRLVSPTEIDDITPGIPCSEIAIYNPDTLYVIPDYNNNSISLNPEWCNYILSLNKTLQLHGVTHTYREFLYTNISQEKLNFDIEEFEKCFNQTPSMFKPPQMKINKENKNLIRKNNLTLRTGLNQLTHKVYHCNDSGRPRNKIINLF